MGIGAGSSVIWWKCPCCGKINGTHLRGESLVTYCTLCAKNVNIKVKTEVEAINH